MSPSPILEAGQAIGKAAKDVIFAANIRAQAAKKRVGAEAVVNATIGTFQTDEETLAWLPTVYKVIQSLPPEDFSAYSPFQGAPEYLSAMEAMTFGDYRPDTGVASIATPGSTGAVRNLFWNYLERHQPALVPDWHWAAYGTIATEHERGVALYTLFDGERRLTWEPLRQALGAQLKTWGRALIVVNDPGQNPTGYDMSEADWDALLSVVREAGAAGQPIVLLLDIPYLDYAARGKDARFFMAKLGDLPVNVLPVLCTSASKSLTLYGMRTGAMIGLSKDKDVLQRFVDANAHSARGVWTNVPRAGMQVLARIHEDKTLMAQVEAEREGFRSTLKSRSDLFIGEAARVGLTLMPYRSGFFISIPTATPAALAEALWEDNIFTVPMKMGIRFAISSVPERKIPGVSAKIKTRLLQQT